MYAAYGADTLRVYEMSMGPLDISRPWDTRSVVGSQRFLQRLWRNVVDEATGEVTVSDETPDDETLTVLHRTIAGVTQDMEAMRENTAIAKLIGLNNHLTTLDRVPRAAIEPLVLMTAPIAPHIGEELWRRLGHDASLIDAPFPVADERWLVEETVTCVIQVAGKVRSRAEVSVSATDEQLTTLALDDPAVVRVLDGRPVRRVIVRAPGLVNVVPG
jgi:leucyl-tRNA synthetase